MEHSFDPGHPWQPFNRIRIRPPTLSQPRSRTRPGRHPILELAAIGVHLELPRGRQVLFRSVATNPARPARPAGPRLDGPDPESSGAPWSSVVLFVLKRPRDMGPAASLGDARTGDDAGQGSHTRTSMDPAQTSRKGRLTLPEKTRPRWIHHPLRKRDKDFAHAIHVGAVLHGGSESMTGWDWHLKLIRKRWISWCLG